MTDNENDLLDVAPGLPHSNVMSEVGAYVIGLALALIASTLVLAATIALAWLRL